MKYTYILIIFIILMTLTYPVFSDYISQVIDPSGEAIFAVNAREGKDLDQLRIMTYNIHHGEGVDGVLDLNRIAQIVLDYNVDIVGLNEVDLLMPRSGLANQTKVLAQKANRNYFFASAMSIGLSQYGNGVLSSLPILNPTGELLPKFMKREPRGFLKFTTKVGKQNVQIIVTHLGLNPVERKNQLDYLAQTIQQIKDPLIMMGDFNTTPSSQAMKDFLKQTGLQVNSFEPTFPADKPELKIDYILTSIHWEVVIEPWSLSTLASDHLPLLATFHLR